MNAYAGKVFLLFLISLGVVSAGSYLIIVDASYSMDEYLPDGDQTKLEAAKAAANDFVDSSPQGNKFAVMRFYGCQDGGNPETGDIRVIEGFTTDKSSVKNAIEDISTGPYTPIAEAIAEGRSYLQDELSSKGTIVLITDGMENCASEPDAAVEEARQTFEDGIGIVYVVSYAIDESETDALELHQQIAEAGGGKYYTADDQEELREILNEIQRTEEPFSGFPCCPTSFLLFGLVGAAIFLRRGS